MIYILIIFSCVDFCHVTSHWLVLLKKIFEVSLDFLTVRDRDCNVYLMVQGYLGFNVFSILADSYISQEAHLYHFRFTSSELSLVCIKLIWNDLSHLLFCSVDRYWNKKELFVESCLLMNPSEFINVPFQLFWCCFNAGKKKKKWMNGHL